MVALMTDLLDPQPVDRVLEVGTGLGYQTAILARLVAQVWSVEIVEEFVESAQNRLKHVGVENVSIRVGDGSRGWAEHAPFDKMIVASGREGSATGAARAAEAGWAPGDPIGGCGGSAPLGRQQER